jgi:hypothetical protein
LLYERDRAPHHPSEEKSLKAIKPSAMRQSSVVGRDSVEPKLDFLGKNYGSTELRCLSPPPPTHYNPLQFPLASPPPIPQNKFMPRQRSIESEQAQWRTTNETDT